jgi:FKBP-type peptidyl-prolyl cis-trans isomerase
MRFTPLAAGLVALSVLAACGNSSESSDTTDSAPVDSAPSDSATDATTDGTTPPAADKPEVELPTEIPTELQVTVLTPGEGPEAVDGDTVVVDYVGVRSEDGTEFDNSYDRGQPFPVRLGAEPPQVIAGWDQGLLGAQAGSRIQLDIPADLAYGDTPQGEVIQPGDALTFVIDVRAVIPGTDPADKPEVTVESAENVDTAVSEDLVEGDGPALEEGQNAVIHLIVFRADTGEEIFSSWEDGETLAFVPGSNTTIPGIEASVDGMNVGGRRQVQVPFAEAFGAEGNEAAGVPAETDLIIVVDLIAAF